MLARYTGTIRNSPYLIAHFTHFFSEKTENHPEQHI